jgi:hypothetical protein
MVISTGTRKVRAKVAHSLNVLTHFFGFTVYSLPGKLDGRLLY